MKTVNVNTELDTKVVSILELYQVVPDLKKFEGVQFKDLKTLLAQFIPPLESAGWEFVQCISGTPLLFIIRKRKSIVVLPDMPMQPIIIPESVNKGYVDQNISSKHEKEVPQESIPVIKIPEIRKIEVEKLFNDKVAF